MSFLDKVFAWDNGKGPWGDVKKPASGRGTRGNAGRKPVGVQPRKGAQNQPDLEDLLQQMQDKIQRLGGGGGRGGNGGGNTKLPMYMIGAAVLIWLASGFYIVKPDQEGVVTRFGAYARTTSEGLHYHLPSPIEEVVKPQVTRENIVGVGYRGAVTNRFGVSTSSNTSVRDVPAESLMLTGDENILDLDFSVRWKIADARSFLFNVKDIPDTIKNVAESAMREVIGQRPIDDALAGNKQEVQDAAQALIQSVLDSYGAGVLITGVELQEVNPPKAVIDAFRDIQAARADAERAVNEAKGYANDIIPRARGEVAQIMQNAEAYKGARVAEAQGAANRFEAQLAEYRKAKNVTKQRLYIETMQKVLAGTSKVVVTGEGGKGIVPYLPLNELKKGGK